MPASSHVATFRQLHQHGLLRLANAWDAGTARLIESLGAPAIATTSAGVAWAQGYPDGDRLPVARVLDVVQAIVRVIRVPLTIDIEGGYSDKPAEVAALAARLADLGVAGINLEDGAGEPAALCAKIEAIRSACAHAGTDLFVNARTDVYLRGMGAAAQRPALTLERAHAYASAGADGLFVPGLSDRAGIETIVSGTTLPLNLLARSALPGAEELQAWGVRRLSAGSNLAESAYHRIAQLAGDFMRDGLSAPLSTQAMPYSGLNGLFDGIAD
ncbi:isocitrate lyase/PEP mutase family protein [Agrilutibacter solisilvae]|uniref:Isocitrate lyase/phosphoenolpyruvate mutase family protein n=1 Tax=Agrilutibacter solisilvae TaxID=2763317 RepID=A0A974XXU9_9GAMM|nr:isocitrate lyase/phosphoenolpyruvate mutase family protein [Lysobacter solisilvae]QSX77801.1 isocitrate lyase/phosphoenolpyruvate mutase family protein [Lysobacter solisilvae]